ncbi:MAG: ABC transporter ATP-binding protein [Planctomycetaceae bacterium]|nr:ABC transporter ATP-binding protein [Planctomycetaceae bacterium]
MNRSASTWYFIWPPMLFVVLFILVWELVVVVFKIPLYLLPAPHQVAEVLWNDSGRLLPATARTALATGIGFFASAAIGVVSGSLLSMVPLARRGIYPLTLLLQMVPLVAIAPMLVIWFGFGLPSVVAAACIVSVFPVIAGTLDGLQSVDKGLVELFQTNKAGPLRTWWSLGLPWSLPSIFTGLRIAAGLSVIGAVVGEFVGGYTGDRAPLGGIIINALRLNRTEVVFAAVVLASTLGFLLFGIVNLAGWLLLRRWHASKG